MRHILAHMQTDLREARRRAGLTLQGLSELSGVDYSTISRLERGKQAPSHHTAQALESALKRKPGSLTFPKLEDQTAKRSGGRVTSVSARRVA